MRRREKTTLQYVGRIGEDVEASCRDTETRQAIQSWAEGRALAGVVWSDLRSNFAKERHESYSVDARMCYFKSLKGESRVQAIDYIQKAPSFVRTPFRTAFRDAIEIAPRA
jgi:hypothetical protein